MKGESCNIGSEFFFRVTQIADHDFCPLLDEQFDDSTADALIAACDDRNFVFQSHFTLPCKRLDATLPRKPPNTQWRALQTRLDNYIFVPLLEANRPHVPPFKSWLIEVRLDGNAHNRQSWDSLYCLTI